MAERSANILPDALIDSSKLSTLRRLTLRMVFPHVNFRCVQYFLSATISTIASPVFREFVLEFAGPSSLYDCLSTRNCWVCWAECDWNEIDKLLTVKFAELEGFRMVIRTEGLQNPEHFREHAETPFRLLASRGCIRFETPILQITDDIL